ncbi:hypothetical protein NMN56_042355, partial [Streptomyces iconiensis]|nr:hypothetical protein [Streptomyces iconiensis]
MKTDVTFPSNGLTLAGHLYVPDGHLTGERLPALVIGHPTTGVKEQTPALTPRLLPIRPGGVLEGGEA